MKAGQKDGSNMLTSFIASGILTMATEITITVIFLPFLHVRIFPRDICVSQCRI